MNNVTLIGRLTKDPELKYTTGNNTAVCQFNIAVDRRFKSDNQPSADFIPVVAWKQTAEFVSKYFNKGSRIAIVGQLQTRSWDDTEGKKHYVMEVIANNVEFCESKQASNNNNYASTEAGYYDGVTPPPAPPTQQTQQAPSDYFPADYDDSDVPF